MTSPKVKKFLEAINAVCREHEISISHEDSHGGFILRPFDQFYEDWLNAADDLSDRSEDDQLKWYYKNRDEREREKTLSPSIPYRKYEMKR